MTDWRLEVLLEPQRTGLSVAEVCRRHEISRDTFYRWKRRFEASGVMGLLARSREPLRQPRRTAPELEDKICAVRRQRPRWGAKKIRAHLIRRGVKVPSKSTVHRVLKRNGLVQPQPNKTPKALLKRFERDEPNDLWQMDAKRFELSCGGHAEVINVLDDHARYHLAGLAVPSADGDAAWQAFRQAARRYGLPRQLYTDNALCFTGRLHGFEVEFERKVRALGVELIHGRPGHPQGRGKIERFHRTQGDYVDDGGGARDVAHLQQLIDTFGDDYNRERPHESLGDLTPAERYRLSPRSLGHEETLDDPSYPPGTIVRLVSAAGVVCWNHIQIALGRKWGGRKVAIDLDDGWIHVRFGDVIVRSVEHHPEIRYHRLPRRIKAG